MTDPWLPLWGSVGHTSQDNLGDFESGIPKTNYDIIKINPGVKGVPRTIRHFAAFSYFVGRHIRLEICCEESYAEYCRTPFLFIPNWG
jgi:hypothetical protein